MCQLIRKTYILFHCTSSITPSVLTLCTKTTEYITAIMFILFKYLRNITIVQMFDVVSNKQY